MGGGPHSGHALALRAARKTDLDAITRIVQAGFPDDPGCNYKFPLRHQHPDDFWHWTRLEYEEYLDQPDKFAVLVVATPADEPIAIGVWDIAIETEATSGGHGIHQRHDVNPEHVRVYANAMARAFSEHFAPYGREQLHLWMLITRPDYRRLGAGTQLCNWGQAESERKGGCALTVMASPMGKCLYEHLGYRLVGAEMARMGDEDELVNIYALEKNKKHAHYAQ